MLLTAHDFTEKALIQTIANRLQNCSSMQPNPNDWLKNKLDEYLQNAHDTALNHGHSRIDLHILSIIPSLYMPDDESDKMDIFSNIIRYYHLQLHPLGWQLHMSEKQICLPQISATKSTAIYWSKSLQHLSKICASCSIPNKLRTDLST